MSQPCTRAGIVALPRRSPTAGPARLAPAPRSLLVGAGLVALALGLYVVARQTSAFAVRHVEVKGAPPEVRTAVRRALAPLVGTSLLALDGAALERRVEALPTVVSARYDRAFPHTLRLTVVVEKTVAVLHRGRSTWLVSARGRVLARVRPLTHTDLARIWVPRRTDVTVGALLPAGAGGTAAGVLALTRHFPARIVTASLTHGELVLRLRSGVAVRLGAPTDVRLKLAIASRALVQLPPGSTYLDVSVAGRPVAGSDSKLSGRG